MAEFTARAGCEDRVAELVGRLADQVRAEPGNVVFDPFTRTERGREYVVVEAYRDDAAFQRHLNSVHSRTFNAELAELIEGAGSDLTWLTPVRPAIHPTER